MDVDKAPNSSQNSTNSSVDSSHSWSSKVKTATTTVIHHARKHTGVGIVCAVAYFDPGNWGVDLQAGSQFGYRLLFVVLLAGIFAVFLQVLASRLGCVTGLDLASHCRLLLHSRPKHTRLYRYLGLYPLYVLSEVAIIATDLAELLGSAIALCMLFPKLQLWHGVLITAFDVVFLLAMKDPLGGRPVRMFELLIGALVLAVLICMCIIISRIDVHWGHAFQGYLPSKYIFQSGGLYTSVGILGATVMPHSIFLGSALATQDRIAFKQTSKEAQESQPTSSSTSPSGSIKAAKPLFQRLRSSPGEVVKGIFTNLLNTFRAPPPSSYTTRAVRHADRENNSLGFVKAHIYHGTIDVMVCLLGFAVGINSLILILASAVFFYGQGSTGAKTEGPASLFDAYDLIRDLVGKPAATLFAIALLSAGQSSSIIATVAGQAVSEGFLQWRVSPVVRRFLTRILAIIPSMIVAISVGRSGIDTLLVASQVVLSVVLPFITFPLIFLTSSKAVMTVYEDGEAGSLATSSGNAGTNQAALESAPERRSVDYSNNKLTTGIGLAIWLLVLTANVYVLTSLAMGNEG